MALRELGTGWGDLLRDALEKTAALATESGLARILAVGIELGECDPLGAFGRFGASDRFFWEQRARKVALSTRGAVLEVEAAPVERAGDGSGIVAAREAIVDAFGRVDCVGPARPLFVGGFAFDARHRALAEWQNFPAGRMVLPELLIQRRGAEATATLCLEIEPGADPLKGFEGLEQAIAEALSLAGALPGCAEEGSRSDGAEYRVVADRAHEIYRGQVASALTAIGRAELEKVVLARSLEVFHPGRFEWLGFLAALRDTFPHCTVLACGRRQDTLVAASPELLLSLDGAEVRTRALAGSAPRGESPEEDAELGNALKESKKEQAEHEAVVRAIRASLAEDCGELDGPEAPELLRVRGIQHLETPLRGRLIASQPGPHILDLLARLHPTPAVAGLPRGAALDWIADREGLQRGWYAGPVGWLDARGGGEFWLALRSALIRNPDSHGDVEEELAWARLFAGAGIVAGSEPEAELRETRLKLRALLAPLTEI